MITAGSDSELPVREAPNVDTDLGHHRPLQRSIQGRPIDPGNDCEASAMPGRGVRQEETTKLLSWPLIGSCDYGYLYALS